ncbi:phospholipid phosphatase 3-like isoform 1-T1 [Odontesthes bonariensis]|uniref:phospholipid phosphatase 3-like isoform X1 n=1 Tax=Odontesthes bonariensis TaxID=219752 RepID=UPI003F58F379
MSSILTSCRKHIRFGEPGVDMLKNVRETSHFLHVLYMHFLFFFPAHARSGALRTSWFVHRPGICTVSMTTSSSQASIPFFACELKAVTPYKRGFICGDSSITYPYLHREAIPDELLIAGGIIITGLTIALGECYRVRFQSISSKAFVRNLYVSCLYKELGCFLFGCCVGQSLTNMAKLSVGRLRPHFLSVCGITYASLNCTPGTYVATVTCDQSDHRLEDEARKSFFSGHASFAMYTMLYLAFYIQARFTWRGARLLRPMLQFFLVLLAVYTGLTRISDYRHHPSDVLTGYIQGALTAYWVAFHISSMFKNSSSDFSLTETPDSPLSPHHTVC